jgi:hypothetical protein
MQRRHFMDTLSFLDPLAHEAERLREEAEKLGPGLERDMLLREGPAGRYGLTRERLTFLARAASTKVKGRPLATAQR